MTNKTLFFKVLTGVFTLALVYVANLVGVFGNFAAFGCLTGFGETPVPESLREE